MKRICPRAGSVCSGAFLQISFISLLHLSAISMMRPSDGGFMNRLCVIIVLVLSLFKAVTFAAEKKSDLTVRNVVLIHGAWADGSSWSEVITRLQSQGMHVTAVQNPLGSLDEAVVAAKWVLDRQDGPTIVAGHSFGGTVMSQMGNDPKVAGLVYVAARAPDANEDFAALSGKYPVGPVRAGLQNFDGIAVISEDAFMKNFANGVAKERAQVLFATQTPTALAALAARTSVAAWHDKPVWYAISKDDQTINPDLQRFMAKRMKAQSIELNAGHLSMVSHSKEISDLIMNAARAASKQTKEKISLNQ
jgi:pimeloyl-ACP methyl ester carboxylesterase